MLLRNNILGALFLGSMISGDTKSSSYTLYSTRSEWRHSLEALESNTTTLIKVMATIRSLQNTNPAYASQLLLEGNRELQKTQQLYRIQLLKKPIFYDIRATFENFKITVSFEQ